MPIQVITKTNRYNKKALYKLEFVFNYSSYPPTHHQRITEAIEHTAWLNSPIRKDAERIGWVEDKKKLPIFDNNEIYLPYAIYNLQSQAMKKYCPHIRSLAPESYDSGIGGGRSTGRGA